MNSDSITGAIAIGLLVVCVGLLGLAAWLAIKKYKQAKVSKTDCESVPVPSKGVLWWTALIGWNVLQMLVGALKRQDVVGTYLTVLVLLFGAISIGVCVWWYGVSQKRKRKKFLSRVSGYLVFGFASLSPLAILINALLPIMTSNSSRNGTVSAGLFFAGGFLVSFLFFGGLLAGAFYLVFQPADKIESDSTK